MMLKPAINLARWAGGLAYRRWNQRTETAPMAARPAAPILNEKLEIALAKQREVLDQTTSDAARGWIAEAARALALFSAYREERTARLDERNAQAADVCAAWADLRAEFPGPKPEAAPVKQARPPMRAVRLSETLKGRK
jgi:hypothetical protein